MAANNDRTTESIEPSAAIAFYQRATMNDELSVGLLMKHTVSALKREMHERMLATGVTTAQWPPLALIGRCGHRTAADLARELLMDAGAMTRMLDRLEEKSLITRSRCENDRRLTRITLTEEGHRAVGPVHQVIADTLNDALRGFSHEEHEQLRSLLSRVLDNLTPSGETVPEEPR